MISNEFYSEFYYEFYYAFYSEFYGRTRIRSVHATRPDEDSGYSAASCALREGPIKTWPVLRLVSR